MKNAQLAQFFFLLFLVNQVRNLPQDHNLDVESGEYNESMDKTIIHGHTTINGIYFETLCKCSEEFGNVSVDDAYCNPSQLKLKQDKEGDGADFDQIRLLIGDITQLEFVDPTKTSFHCMDGRENNAILATPGGDFGEFLLALYIYEGLTRPLDQKAIDIFFTEYLKWMKKDTFYMCTDDDAISHIEQELGITLTIEQLRFPQRKDQRDILRSLLSAENQGDRHLKSMLKNYNLYNIRQELVQMFIISFFKILWNQENPLKSKLVLESLVGRPNEIAFLEVRSNEVCKQYELSPKLLSKKRIVEENYMLQVFLNHIDAASQYRKTISNFFSDDVNHRQQPIDNQVMYHRMNKHGLSFLEITGSKVAKYLPFYSLDLI